MTIQVKHPTIGRHAAVGPPWKLGTTPAKVRRGGPELGEHNKYVFGELLGLSKREIDQLTEEQILY
ncbi:hypothetical protein ACFLWN_04950 [Chloroflexota bacterium]